MKKRRQVPEYRGFLNTSESQGSRESVSVVWKNFSQLTAQIAFLRFQQNSANEVQTELDAREYTKFINLQFFQLARVKGEIDGKSEK